VYYVFYAIYEREKNITLSRSSRLFGSSSFSRLGGFLNFSLGGITFLKVGKSLNISFLIN